MRLFERKRKPEPVAKFTTYRAMRCYIAGQCDGEREVRITVDDIMQALDIAYQAGKAGL